MAANRRLFAACRRERSLVPVPIVNPLLANWQEQLAECATAGVRAVRLVPNYHNYRLSAPLLDAFMAAIQAAKIGKRAAVIERARTVGGVCVNTGTIPSKTFREAVMHLSGFRERGIYGSSYRVKQDISIDDLLYRVQQVVRSEIDVIRNQMTRLHQEIAKVLARPDVKERLEGAGAMAVGSTPEEMTVYIKREFARWSKLIKSVGIKID